MSMHQMGMKACWRPQDLLDFCCAFHSDLPQVLRVGKELWARVWFLIMALKTLGFIERA